MRFQRPVLGCAALLAIAIAACGSSGQPAVVVRVAGQPITRAAVEHWTAVMAAGRSPADFKAKGKSGLRSQALGFLITSAWLMRQADEQALVVSDQDVRRRLSQIQETQFPGGMQEYREYLKGAGQTIADATLEARIELTTARLRKRIVDHARSVTRAQVAAYYQGHQQQFVVPEQREAAVINRKTKAEVQRLKREVLAGKSLISRAQRRAHEGIVTISRPATGDEPLARAIYAAKPDRLEGPIVKGVDYVLFKVRRVLPASVEPLADVEGKLHEQLAEERERAALAAYSAMLGRRWPARTDCLPGYVIDQCRQYRGPRGQADYLALR